MAKKTTRKPRRPCGPKLDMDKIAKGLGAERRGKVSTSAGSFGAQQLLAEHRRAGR